jgi:hypothetical protein
VGFGLSSNILPFFPICHQLSPSSLNLSSFSLCLNFVTISFLLCGVVSPTPNPQPGGPGYPFLSGSSPLTCLVWEALPVAYASQHSSWDHVTTQAPLLRQSRDTFGGIKHILGNEINQSKITMVNNLIVNHIRQILGAVKFKRFYRSVSYLET